MLGHPESPQRLLAALRGTELAARHIELVSFAPRPVQAFELERVHDAKFVASLAQLGRESIVNLDADTYLGPGSIEAALRAAGAGLEAIERLDAGEARAAFLALRPPGHHAGRSNARGFCLFNNLAVSAAALAARGERVLVVDFDAHHGNGTQEIFYDSSAVFYASFHQHPAYPGTGALHERGSAAGLGTTLNFPFPRRTTGDAYRLAIAEVLIPAVEHFSPTWLLLSAGFDAHRDDPLTDLGLSAGDFGDLTERLCRLVAPGRRIAFLEGGYDLAALSSCVAACVVALGGGSYRPEPASSGGRNGQFGADPAGQPAAVVYAARALQSELT